MEKPPAGFTACGRLFYKLYIGGLLFDRFGFQAPILANLIGVTIALVAIVVAVKEPSRE